MTVEGGVSSFMIGKMSQILLGSRGVASALLLVGGVSRCIYIPRGGGGGGGGGWEGGWGGKVDVKGISRSLEPRGGRFWQNLETKALEGEREEAANLRTCRRREAQLRKEKELSNFSWGGVRELLKKADSSRRWGDLDLHRGSKDGSTSNQSEVESD